MPSSCLISLSESDSAYSTRHAAGLVRYAGQIKGPLRSLSPAVRFNAKVVRRMHNYTYLVLTVQAKIMNVVRWFRRQCRRRRSVVIKPPSIVACSVLASAQYSSVALFTSAVLSNQPERT